MNEIQVSVDPMKFDKYYFPINVNQVEDLLGKTLTQLEVMNLRNEKATKDVFRQMIWNWYSGVQENSMTSYQGCIAPIFSFSNHGEILPKGPQTNRWDRICPNGCNQENKMGCSQCPPRADEDGSPTIVQEYDEKTGETSERLATLEDAQPKE